MGGAIAGVDLGLTLRGFSSPGLPREANHADGAQIDATISVMAASAFSLIDLFERSQRRRASSST